MPKPPRHTLLETSNEFAQALVKVAETLASEYRESFSAACLDRPELSSERTLAAFTINTIVSRLKQEASWASELATIYEIRSIKESTSLDPR